MKDGKKKAFINQDYCFVCGSPYIQMHHIFYGTSNRKNSDEMGYVIALCNEHHKGNKGVHFNKTLDNQLKKIAQEHFEANYGSRNDFRKIFGKSFI